MAQMMRILQIETCPKRLGPVYVSDKDRKPRRRVAGNALDGVPVRGAETHSSEGLLSIQGQSRRPRTRVESIRLRSPQTYPQPRPQLPSRVLALRYDPRERF